MKKISTFLCGCLIGLTAYSTSLWIEYLFAHSVRMAAIRQGEFSYLLTLITTAILMSTFYRLSDLHITRKNLFGLTFTGGISFILFFLAGQRIIQDITASDFHFLIGYEQSYWFTAMKGLVLSTVIFFVGTFLNSIKYV